MKYFDLTKNYNVECEWKDKNDGFKHVATLYKDNKKLFKTTVNYINRTWESYDFESILKQVVDLQFKNKAEHKYFRDIVVNYK